MLKLKIGEKELKVKFGYKPTLKERVISKITALSGADGEDGADYEKVEDLLLYLPEILLVGLQVYHEEYRYDYDTKKGKQEQLDKVFDLVDEYSNSGGDLIGLFNDMQNEMQNDSFLSGLLRRAKAVEESETAVQEQQSGKN